MKTVLAAIETEFDRLNQSVASSLYTDVDLVDDIGQYIIDAGGKRIRPILVILWSKAFGAVTDDAIKFATIIEYIHTATLLHDDVVDLSTMRRGRKTVNAEWGNAPAVLVGDFIYSRAFELLVEIGNTDIMGLMAATTNRIAAGEVLQLAKAGSSDLSKDTYFDIIDRKTAILFEAACKGAAILSGQPKTIINHAGDYGKHVGLAFQIIDDYLDYAGESEAMGKNLGDDLAEGKTTLPLILAMEQADTDKAAVIATAIENKDIAAIDAVTAIVKTTNALQDTQSQAIAQADTAKTSVDSALAECEALDLLNCIADLAVKRSQ